MIRSCWYALGFSGELRPGELGGHVIAGRPVVSWRSSSGEVVALDARCAHKRFPLWDGKLLDSGVLECAYHGFCYDADGLCVAIPALHDRSDRIPATARQHKFPVVEQDGVVWIWPGDPARSGEMAVPATPEIASPLWETLRTEPMEVEASYRLLIENLFDLTHFYPLHNGNIGSLADAAVPVRIERDIERRVLRTIRRRESFVLPPMTRDRFGMEIADQVQIHEMVGPGLFRVWVGVAPPGELGTDSELGFVLHQTITPVTAGRHVWRRATSCRVGTRWSGNPESSLVEAIVSGAPTVIEQDRWAIERQQAMLAFPDEGYREVHIKTDGAVVMARRMLDDLESAESGGTPCEEPSHTRSQRNRATRDLGAAAAGLASSDA
ncbi:MAG: Rieske 2Fe-2S domain-containing protein [Acidimicrobiales bacterium]